MSLKTYTIYYDVNSRIAYDGSLSEISNANRPNLYFTETMEITFQYLNSDSKDDDTGLFDDFYTGFSESSIVSTVAIDNNNKFYDSTTLDTQLTGTVAVSQVVVSSTNVTSPREAGVLVIDSTDTVYYNGFDYDSGDSTYTFYTADSDFNTADYTPSETFLSGVAVKVKETPLVRSTDIDDSDKNTGKFIVTLNANTIPLFYAINNSASLSDEVRIEHQVFILGESFPSFVAQADFSFTNLIDYDGDDPPIGTANEYYTATEVRALIESIAAYSLSFDDDDLTADSITFTHNLNSLAINPAIRDSSGELIEISPTSVTLDSETYDLSSFTPLTGTWYYIAGGGLSSISFDEDITSPISITQDSSVTLDRSAGAKQTIDITGSSDVGFVFENFSFGNNLELYINSTTYTGTVSFNYDWFDLSTWTAGTYAEDDKVKYLGVAYNSNTASNTETPSATATNWDKIDAVAFIAETLVIPENGFVRIIFTREKELGKISAMIISKEDYDA